MQIAASQYDSSVGIGPEGDLIVVWNGYNANRVGWDIYARGFEADGRAYGKEILVNTRQVGQTRDPHVAMLPGGGFMVTWTGGELNGAGWEVYGRTYAATYEAGTDAYQINTVTLGYVFGHQQYAVAAVGSGPRALIAWSGRGQPDHQGAYADVWEVGYVGGPFRDFINDAFEIALVDQDGNPVATPYTTGRDALFNISEGLSAAYRSGITFDGSTVTVGLSDLPAGLPVTLIFRLVNNDSDTTTTVRITDFAVTPSASLPSPRYSGVRGP